MRRAAILAALLLAATVVHAEVYPNYALNCRAVSSSVWKAWYPAELAVDGLLETRWISARTDDEWIWLDLGEMRRIGRITLDWERSTGLRYAVQLSVDNEHYTDVFTEEDGKQKEFRTIDISPCEARYLRVICLERTNEYGFSLREIGVYPPVKNLAYSCRVDASAALPDHPPAAVTDGSAETGWRVAGTKTQWIRIDLGVSRLLGKIVLNWGPAAAKDYTVEISDDGRHYSTISRRRNRKPGQTETIVFSPKRFQYIRVYCRTLFDKSDCGLAEIEVYPK